MEYTDKELVESIVEETPEWAFKLRRASKKLQDEKKEEQKEQVRKYLTSIKEANVVHENCTREQDLEEMGLSDMLEATIRGKF